MRDRFPGYYRPTSAQFAQLWSKGEIVLDTNVLLHIYRYGSTAREHLLTILEKVQARLWIPYQVGLEFHRRRADLVSHQAGAYDAISKSLEALLAKLRSDLDPYRSRHSQIDVASIEKPLQRTVARIRRELEKLKADHPNLLHDDPLRDRLAKLLDGKVGPAPTEVAKIRKEAEARLEAGIPPGTRDKSKPDGGVGDVLLWMQLLEHAGSSKKPTIVVTDDAKDDWWSIHKGQTIGPRPELVEEFQRAAEATFWMYPSDRFIEEAEKFLAVPAKPAVVDEVREIRRAEIASASSSALAFHRELARQSAALRAQFAVPSWSSALQEAAMRRDLLLSRDLSAMGKLASEAAQAKMNLGLGGDLNSGALAASAELRRQLEVLGRFQSFSATRAALEAYRGGLLDHPELAAGDKQDSDAEDDASEIPEEDGSGG
jgi:hypothetical protein